MQIAELILFIQSILDRINEDQNFEQTEEHAQLEKIALEYLPYNFETDEDCHNYCLKATMPEIWEYHLQRLKKLPTETNTIPEQIEFLIAFIDVWNAAKNDNVLPHLTEALNVFCENNNLPLMSADELLCEVINKRDIPNYIIPNING